MLDGDCTRQDMAGQFLKQLAGHFANETAVATPNAQHLSADPVAGLAKWKKLPQADRQQLTPMGKYDLALDPAPPEGGLVLNVYARGLEFQEGQWRTYRHPRAHLSKEPGRDHLWLTEKEWQSLIPMESAKGDRHEVPALLTDRICRRYLIDLVRQGGEGGPRRREDVLKQKLSVVLEEQTAGQRRYRLEGTATYLSRGLEFGIFAEASRRDTFGLLGYIDYDTKKKAISRFDLVAVSPTGHYDQIGKKLVPLGVSFELTEAKAPADRVRPSSYFSDYFSVAK